MNHNHVILIFQNYKKQIPVLTTLVLKSTTYVLILKLKKTVN